MRNLGRNQRFCLAACILGALIVGWCNASAFFWLNKGDLDADPATLRALRAQLSLLETLTADQTRHLSDRQALERFFAAYHMPGHTAVIATTAAAAPDGQGTAPEAVLPGLSGILQKVDGRGLPYYRAVLDGRVCAPNDQLGLFTVGPITGEGVFLQRGDKQWFLASPKPYYSSDLGR